MKVIKVLLIEDDETYRELVKALLRESRLQVETAETDSSDQALEILKNNDFDCALVDYRLPKTTGLDIFREARKCGINLPFIIMSGYDDRDLEEKYIAEGVSAFIPKDNINLEILQYTIETVVTFAHHEKYLEGSKTKLKMGEIGDFMSSPPLSVDSETTSKEVIDNFNIRKVSSLLVKKDEKYVGIVTKRDIIHKVIAKKLDRETTKVSEIMTNKILSMDRHTTTEEINEFMIANEIRHLAVTENGEIVGVISTKDILAT